MPLRASILLIRSLRGQEVKASKTSPESITVASHVRRRAVWSSWLQGSDPCVRSKGQGLRQPCTACCYQALGFSLSQNQKDSGDLLPLKHSIKWKRLISHILAEKKRKRQKTQGHNPVLMFLKRHSQESRASNPVVLRKFPQYLPSSKIFLNHCQFKAVPSPSIQRWGLEPSQSTVWGMDTFQTDSFHKGLDMT